MEPEILSRSQTGWTARDDFVTFQNRFMVCSHSNRTEVCDGGKYAVFVIFSQLYS